MAYFKNKSISIVMNLTKINVSLVSITEQTHEEVIDWKIV